jgi:hypothetical protein
LVIVLPILGALAAVAIAVAFDSPTSVILLAALAAGAGENRIDRRRESLSTVSRMTSR